jgi:transcriptional regulator with XRE-family HTH domain
MLIQNKEKIELDIARCNLRGRISSLMDQKDMTQKDIAETTGIHTTTLSKILKDDDPRPMSLEHLDMITSVLGLEKGTLYSDFVSECVDKQGKFKVAKSEEFVVSCYTVNLPSLAKALTEELLTQEKNNKDIVLRISDKLYENKLFSHALNLYDEIIKEEQKKSAKLAMCYFKKFMILRDQDLQGKGKEALVRLLEYLIILPDEYIDTEKGKYNTKLDAYYRVITYFNVMEDWDSLLEYARDLETVSRALNDEKYLGESLLYQGFAYKGMGDFDNVFKIIKKYENINGYYQNLARGSKLFTEIEMGELEKIPQYLEWASSDKDICTLIPVAVEAFLKNGSITEGLKFIKDYSGYIQKLSKMTFIPDIKRYMRFKHAEALLLIKNAEIIDGINSTIKVIELAKQLGNINRLSSSMSLLYKNYQYITKNQEEALQMILERR